MQIETITARKAVDNAFLQKTIIEADTSELEEEIDQLVYELYGLSEEEIEIVEESVSLNNVLKLYL